MNNTTMNHTIMNHTTAMNTTAMNTTIMNTKKAKAIATAMSKDKKRKAFMHLYVDSNGDMAATDGQRMHMSNKDMAAPDQSNYALIPAKTVKALRGKEFTFRIDGYAMEINGEAMPKNEGGFTYPNFCQVIPAKDGDYQCKSSGSGSGSGSGKSTGRDELKPLVDALKALPKNTSLRMEICMGALVFTSGEIAKDTKLKPAQEVMVEVASGSTWLHKDMLSNLNNLWAEAFDMRFYTTPDTTLTAFNSTFLSDALGLSECGCTVHFWRGRHQQQALKVNYTDGSLAVVMPLRCP